MLDGCRRVLRWLFVNGRNARGLLRSRDGGGVESLGEFAQGRVLLNVSIGNILNLGESGVEAVKPIRIMREYVDALRALWTGKPVTYDGTLHKLRGAKMVFDQGRQYPIYIASTGPQMLKLAGEIAD